MPFNKQNENFRLKIVLLLTQESETFFINFSTLGVLTHNYHVICYVCELSDHFLKLDGKE